MKELESKLQFVITIALFFPVLMTALLKDKADNPTLQWGILVIFLIMDYLYIDSLKKEIPAEVKRWINLFLDINILLFIPLIFAFSVPIKSLTITKVVFLTGLWGVMLMPIFILSLLIGSAIYRTFPKFFNRIKG